jgi:alpha,alpha-trehalose phosphorylase
VIAPDVEPEPWKVTETSLDLDHLGRSESIFALANGHLGLRGNLDEGEPRAMSGTYLNGFFESYPLEYGERGFGFAEDGQAVVNVTDGKIIRLLVEDEPLDVHRGRLEKHVRTLDLRAGTLTRDVQWRSDYNRAVRVTSRRLVSFDDRSVAAITYEVEALERPVRVAIQSNLQANQTDRPGGADPRAGKALGNVLESRLDASEGYRVVLGHRTRRSDLSLCAGMDHEIHTDAAISDLTQDEPDLGRVTISVQLEPGKPVRLDKFLAYHWSSVQSPGWLRDQVDASLQIAMAKGWDGLAAQQRAFLDEFWTRADVDIEGDIEAQQALRFALFHLLQASARIEGRAIPAKGLTGPGYDGHAFWDTESFVLPVLSYISPNVVRDALRWRHSILDKARERAKYLGLKGATLPWRTIDGEECSGYWPAGTAGFHINADVADAVRRYQEITHDDEFERQCGIELLVESARLWTSLGHHDDLGRFRISGVTGPDEYSALVDNNVYTNLMAQTNLRAACAAVDRHPDRAEELGITADERRAWDHAARAMYVPHDERLDVTPQDEDFTHHERWPFEETPPEKYPLLLHYPYFQLYRKQVVKQADLVLAMFTRGDAFDSELKLRNFDYYEQITVRDSSLSACTQAIMAAEVGHLELAHDYFREAALMDLEDLAHNAGDGVHMASLAGAVMAAVAGFGGLRDFGGKLRFKPRLPKEITSLRFALTVRDVRLRVEVAPKEVAYTLERGESLRIAHYGEPVDLVLEERATRPIPARHELKPPRQPRGREPRGRVRRKDIPT